MKILVRFIISLVLVFMLVGCESRVYYCDAANERIEIKNEWGAYTSQTLPFRRYQTRLFNTGSIRNVSDRSLAIEQNRIYVRAGIEPIDGFILAPYKSRQLSFSGREVFVIKSVDGKVRLGVLESNVLCR